MNNFLADPLVRGLASNGIRFANLNGAGYGELLYRVHGGFHCGPGADGKAAERAYARTEYPLSLPQKALLRRVWDDFPEKEDPGRHLLGMYGTRQKRERFLPGNADTGTSDLRSIPAALL